MKNFPKIIPIFPLNNFIFFPKTSVPLNIFEPRYLDMVTDSMASNKLIGIVQPINSFENKNLEPDLYKIGCLGEITEFNKTKDGRFLIEIKGLTRFEILNELNSNKKYREFEVNYSEYSQDLSNNKEELKFSDLELIFKDFKSLFEKKGFIINWSALEKQSLDEIINALAMASPFSLEEKQVLLEAKTLEVRKHKISEILSTYTHDFYENTTLQ